MTTPAPTTYVPIRALGRRWHIDRRVVQKWIAAGILPAVRFPGGICRVALVDVIAFETAHAIRHVPPDAQQRRAS